MAKFPRNKTCVQWCVLLAESPRQLADSRKMPSTAASSSTAFEAAVLHSFVQSFLFFEISLLLLLHLLRVSRDLFLVLVVLPLHKVSLFPRRSTLPKYKYGIADSPLFRATALPTCNGGNSRSSASSRCQADAEEGWALCSPWPSPKTSQSSQQRPDASDRGRLLQLAHPRHLSLCRSRPKPVSGMFQCLHKIMLGHTSSSCQQVD